MYIYVCVCIYIYIYETYEKYVSHLYLFIYLWKLRLFPYLGHGK